MSSQRRIEANPRNARRSTGPKSPEIVLALICGRWRYSGICRRETASLYLEIDIDISSIAEKSFTIGHGTPYVLPRLGKFPALRQPTPLTPSTSTITSLTRSTQKSKNEANPEVTEVTYVKNIARLPGRRLRFRLFFALALLGPCDGRATFPTARQVHRQRRFERIFVDESQDTAPGKLSLVGDPKQSIYKFRRAGMVLYREVRDLLARRGVAVVELTRSFRSIRPIQECVNAGFAPEMTGDAVSGQAPYAPLHEYAAPIPNQPAIVALPAPSPYSPKTRKITKAAVKDCLPDAVAAFLEWLLAHSGWKVRDPARPNTLTPVAARHVCVLFRRMLNYGEDVTRAYVHALENRGLTHLLAGSKSFHQREEVETMRNALTAIEWPDDALSVYATLRGSLFSFPDALLLRFRHAAGHLYPFRPIPADLDEELAPVAEALQLLQTWHRERNRRPAAATVSAVLEAVRAHAGFAFRPAGNQVLANVYRVAGLARRFEAGGGLSFRGFVEMLAAEAELRESAEAPVLEEGADGVRLMTVHAAKGLEFPVVVLADPTVNIRAPNPERYLDAPRRLCALRLLRFAPYELIEHERLEQDREHAEGVRVAYVAATRARDLLVVPAVAEKPMDGWLAPLNRALYPPVDTWSAAGRVPPGRHRPQEGAHEVVWWDLKTLRLGVEADFSLRQQEVLAPTEPGASEGRARYTEWAASRAATLAAGAAPSRRIFTPTEVSEPPPGFAVEVEVEAVPRAAGRPAGKRFGALVHALLSVVDYGAAPHQVQAMAATEARLFGATVEERDAAAEAVSRALEHPLLKAARRAANVHREAPILVPVEDGRTLEGVVDLLFAEDGVWCIVDFKTDAEPDDVARYRAQLAWYAYAVARLTRAPVRCTLLAV